MILENVNNNPAKVGAEISDEELVRLTLANQEYFLHIIQRYKMKLYRYVLRIANIDPEEVEDILQEVFMKVYQNLNGFDSSLKFSSWIYRITHNQVISNFRKLQARPQKANFDLDDDIIHNIASEFDMVNNLDNKILRTNIFKIIDQLSIKYREVLILKFLEEKSYKEIADIIKKPIGTVGSLMSRAKQEFKKELLRQNIKI